MNALSIHSINGFQIQGSAAIVVGRARVVFEKRGLSEIVAVYAGRGLVPVKTWGRVLPETIRAALDEAERLSGFVPTLPDSDGLSADAVRSPECQEDASGRCIHPLHNHEGEKA